MMVRVPSRFHNSHPDLLLVVDVDEQWFGPLHTINGFHEVKSHWDITPYDFERSGLLADLSDDYFDWLPEQ